MAVAKLHLKLSKMQTNTVFSNAAARTSGCRALFEGRRRIGILLAGLVLALGAQAGAVDPGVRDKAIVLGMTAPFTGPAGAYGVEMRTVIQAYFDRVNRTGGVNGRRLELVAEDDGYEAEKAVSNTLDLINHEKVFALLASYGSTSTIEAMNRGFGPARVPLVGTISGSDVLRGSTAANANLRYLFNVRASYADETRAIVNQLVSQGLTRIAVFYQDDGFGKSGLEGVVTALKSHQLAPVAQATVARNSVDVAAAVNTLSAAAPQAIVMVTLYKPTAEFVRAMKKLSQHPQLVALSPVGADMLVKELGDDARGLGISQVMPYPWSQNSALVKEYQQLMAGDSSRFSYYGVEAYAMAKLMTEALRLCGRELTRQNLVNVLESLGNVDLGGLRIGYSADSHAGSSFVDITVIGSGGRVLR